MFILTKDPSRWKHLAGNPDHEVVDNFFQYSSSERLANELGYRSFRELEGTRSGPCLVIGMGNSRNLLRDRAITVPTFAINRAILEFPHAEFWCCHDIGDSTDFIAKTPPDTTLVTYSSNVRKSEWGTVKQRQVFLLEIFTDPRRHKKRPLFWNQTTVGWTFDLAIRMGFDPIYSIGIDNSRASYVNPHWPAEKLALQHDGVKERILEMFWERNLGAWNSKGAKVIDLAGDLGYLPTERADVGAVTS